jgi:hypothetical protein
MPDPFLLSRVLLQFDHESATDFLEELSAVVVSPDGSLWVGSDELNILARLSPVKPGRFGDYHPFNVADFLPLLGDDEIDVEGMDYVDSYLWLTGSHSLKRKKPKGKKAAKDILKLAEIKQELNRYLIARIPLVDGKLVDGKLVDGKLVDGKSLTPTYLERTATGNLLTDALQKDEHLGAFFTAGLPSKENGLDIEGLAVHGDRLFLGLRGPVLRGWAIILEIEVEERELGILGLKPMDKSGQLYRKHFLDLNGLGIRDLCFDQRDLLILAGPTMALDGATRIFRLKEGLEQDGDSLVGADSPNLEVLFDLPWVTGGDRAEGLTLFPFLGIPAVLVVYDTPHISRKIGRDRVFADIFRIQQG